MGFEVETMISITNDGAVRSLLLDRPEALNAFNNAMFDDLTDALLAAAKDETVKVVTLSGAGRAFSAGLDLASIGADEPEPKHGFPGLYEALLEFPKPLLLAINGLGVGVGCTICGLVDLVFMAKSARLRCPFSALGLTAEAGSSITFPALLGHQAATWVLMSSEWLDADTCQRLGLTFATVADAELLSVTQQHAQILAAQPLASLMTTKELLMVPRREALRSAHELEGAAMASLMGGAANQEAIAAFRQKRTPDFSEL